MTDSVERDVQCQACGRWHPRERACQVSTEDLLKRAALAESAKPPASAETDILGLQLAEIARLSAALDAERAAHEATKHKAAADLSEAHRLYARGMGELRADVERLTRERDESRSELANVKMGANELHHEVQRLTRKLAEMRKLLECWVDHGGALDLWDDTRAALARRSGK